MFLLSPHHVQTYYMNVCQHREGTAKSLAVVSQTTCMRCPLVEGEVNRSHLNCFPEYTAIGSWRIYQHLQRGAKWFRCRVSIHKHLYSLWPLKMVPFYLHWWPFENCTPTSLNFSRWGWFYFHFYFHPYLEKWSNLTHIFQMGWFNHQAVFNGNAILIR